MNVSASIACGSTACGVFTAHDVQCRADLIADTMNDRRIPADPERVNTHSDAEAAYWCTEFDCTRDELREAVSAVGETARDVRLHLSQRGH